MPVLTERDRRREAELWRRGILWPIPGLLHADQQDAYRRIQESNASRFVLEIARRWGKTWLLVVLAIEACLRRPKSRVVFGAPTLKHLAEYVLPTFDELASRAPPDVRPIWKASLGHWVFANGSHVHLFGADDRRKAERGRGSEAQLVIFDEAAFTPVLDYALNTVLKPQLWHSGGRMVLSSTPAAEPEHPFTKIAEVEEPSGNYLRRTIHDNPRLTKQRIAEIIAESAREMGLTVEQFMATDDFRREFLAERVVSKSLVVIPEWEAKRHSLRQAVPRPEFFDGMTVLDFGGADPHAANLGYWHFPLAKWVVEQEVLLREHQNSAELAKAIKAAEREAWGVARFDGSLRAGVESPTETLTDNLPEWMVDILTKEAPEQPFARWADNDLQLVRDLYELHGMAFIPTAKDDLELQVNNLRVAINADQVLIHPRCVHTDRHLRSTTWANHKRREFKRTAAGEHGDLVATLIYGQRNLDKRNPFPAGYSLPANANIGARVRAKEEHADFGADLLADSALGRRMLRRARR
jgi:hypothetical protein